jgi:membrane-associated phospholipid phosphatase
LDVDRRALLALRTRGHTPAVERAVAVYSRLGEHAACWLSLGVAGAALSDEREARRAWLRGAVAVVIAYGANYAVKAAVRRPRPDLAGLPPLTGVVSGLSFPSAHATTSFAAAKMYSGLVPAPVLYTAATLFALSRPYLGVHYPSDVLGGALLGTAIAGGAVASRQLPPRPALGNGDPACR